MLTIPKSTLDNSLIIGLVLSIHAILNTYLKKSHLLHNDGIPITRYVVEHFEYRAILYRWNIYIN